MRTWLPATRRLVTPWLVPVVLAACVHAQPTRKPMTWPALDAQLLADSAATFNFRLGLPSALAVTPDGAVLFRRTGPRSFAADLSELDTKTGKVKTLFSVAQAADEKLSDAEKARRERTRTATRGVVDIDVSADGRLVMIPMSGEMVLIDRTNGKTVTWTLEGELYDPHLSPDGSRIAFVRGGDLWVVDANGGVPHQLTKHPEGFEYAVADFAAQEELGRTRGYWWSPDSKSIVFQRTDNRPIDTLYVADARHPEKPPVPFKSPRAGRPNAVVDLGIIAATGGEPRWLPWPVDKYPYLARVTWGERGPLSIVVLSREQQDLAVFAFDAKGEGKTLLTEHDDAWLEVPSTRGGFGYALGSPLWLADGTFLWMTEQHGDSWTIEQRSADGTVLRQITKPDLALTMTSAPSTSSSGRAPIRCAAASGACRSPAAHRCASGPTMASRPPTTTTA